MRQWLRQVGSQGGPGRRGAAAKGSAGRPPGKLTQLQKVSRLHELLSRHPSGVTLSEIAAALRVDPRSARRYLTALRADLRLDLESVTGAGGKKRWRIPAVDLPRRLELRRTQAYALLAARPLFEVMRGSAVHQEIDLAIESLIGVARRPGRGPNAGHAGEGLERRFCYLPFAPKDYRERSEDLDTLFHAVADLRPVSLSYPAPGGGAGTQRLVVHPYALVLYKEAIYALAGDVRSGAVRTLELELVRGARCLEGERFALPDDFSVEDYAQGQFGLWRARSATAAVIDFDPRAAAQIATRKFHASQRIEPLPNGGVRMHLQLGQHAELASWVMGFGPLAVVREPRELRREIERALTAALRRYRRPNGPPSRSRKSRAVNAVRR